MRETRPVCDECRHEFHAMGQCTGFYKGNRCPCAGTWYDEARAISGFCYVLYGTPVERDLASHAACPGKNYPYPCECECHSDSFTHPSLTPPPGRLSLES